MAYLQLNNIEKFFGEHHAIKGIDLAIEQGEFVVFVGPSGCGKSTLLRLIAGLEPIDKGSLHLDGRDITALPSSRRDLAMVFQSYALYPHMTVFQNMSFALKLAGVAPALIRAKVDKAAAILNLGDYLERKPKELSGGQRQRVAIGRAIVRDPKVFLFDEPLSNLDAALRVQTRIEIAKLHRELGATTIYVTHDQVEAMTLADRVVVLRDGRIEQHGSPLALYDNPANRFVAQFIGTPSMNVVPAAGLPRLAAGVTPGDGFVGIRPEHVHVLPAAQPGSLPATVDMVESLGVETLVYARLENNVQVVARGSERIALQPGARTHLAFEHGFVHHFDKLGSTCGAPAQGAQ
ncbi:sn-glycerol-3-phosphate ABC transporter ATP-binding protein UgpC [Massilia atriviolacea]|uniref:sn-glycerol-3-phosphate ABC transporter ATP-binding protein UgpC n=1 Tax=Massilia atriviolacea TaxID=2495579 RepID=A0A430HNT0_9BURK|nr:sn-glycerol-3-phosphate ABC transporter ATP-binding protein UgpC [Massilia atriviolacea]RSZ59159.1 sn-glycerol-3-phosphate ABC transporter ATP-binding protein UgpC [Massilia atriviolacea]